MKRVIREVFPTVECELAFGPCGAGEGRRIAGMEAGMKRTVLTTLFTEEDEPERKVLLAFLFEW